VACLGDEPSAVSDVSTNVFYFSTANVDFCDEFVVPKSRLPTAAAAEMHSLGSHGSAEGWSGGLPPMCKFALAEESSASNQSGDRLCCTLFRNSNFAFPPRRASRWLLPRPLSRAGHSRLILRRAIPGPVIQFYLALKRFVSLYAVLASV
jgi:hypothetical protein